MQRRQVMILFVWGNHESEAFDEVAVELGGSGNKALVYIEVDSVHYVQV